MSHTEAFRNLWRFFGIASCCEAQNISTREGLQRVAEMEAKAREQRVSRRSFLGDVGKLALLGAASAMAGPPGLARGKPQGAAQPRIAIVGAGLAGLACADALKSSGIQATLYDASNRVGGRCYSLGGFFPGQVAERGGEFIDNLHKTMIGYARRFKLILEDVNKNPAGQTFYYFGGQHYPEAAIVQEFRALVQAMRVDLRRIGKPTALNFTPDDAFFDNTSLRDYLISRGAGALVSKAIEQAYIAEYGLEIDQQSCLNFLLFARADRRSRFQPFGASNERYHVVGGNEMIVQGLASTLSGQIRTGVKLVKACLRVTGEIDLIFDTGAGVDGVTCDAVVFAIPFSTLRAVDLSGLDLPAWKLFAINELRYGANAKMMVGFDARPWLALGSNGKSYSDLANHQATWETNPTRATAQRAVLTDYSGGHRGIALAAATADEASLQAAAQLFLNDLNQVYPGALGAASRPFGPHGPVRAFLEHWPSNPLHQGSYTCNHPGYFTTIADNEGTAVGNIHFAGEHTSSFYEYQGFMEGAALSGLRAAREILQKIKVGAL